MKKVIFFLVFIIILFAGVAFLSNMQKEKAVEGNMYKKDNLKPETIELLDDPNYQNIILPSELEEKLKTEEDVTVYFFSSDCMYCKQTTPELMPLAEELNVSIDQYNLWEFEEGWDKYNIESTPTIVQYKNGEEVSRINGYREPAVFKQWLEEYSVTK
ncbi:MULTISPECIES: thioredoxin family protein [Niallia]|uniref:thioredoxin family protein n=1 Tax=Niallia TaxID=2837506 RepID=UPI000332A060|nr:thioredoxin family protein [Niallia alba]EOR25196.1 thioredoxin domain-containing protein [Niallia nealsonii AAU1]MDU1845500.1 thioredoxin family protein [Niallia nealsonii]MED3794600.1 thioredoxin family protein [Niallia alba]